LLPFWAVVVTYAFWEIAGRKNFRLLWLASAAGLASHLLLDWITNYGTMLWWSVSDARLALSLVFIVDPYVWSILGVGLWAAIRTQRARVADAALAVFGAYLLFCAAGKWIVTRDTPPQAIAYPVPLDPLRWTVVWEDDQVLHWRNREDRKEFTQFQDDVLRPRAEATAAVKLFRWFAAFPLVEKLEQDGHTVLRYRDLRFRTPLPWGEVREGMFVIVKVVFDHEGHLLAADLTREK
jgi:inner membrane protein